MRCNLTIISKKFLLTGLRKCGDFAQAPLGREGLSVATSRARECECGGGVRGGTAGVTAADEFSWTLPKNKKQW